MQENISPGQPPRSPQYPGPSTHDPHVSIALGEQPNYFLFWGCFLALVTTAFGFIGRIFLIGEWGTEFNLEDAQKGRLLGIGIWPFAVSIIGFSLIIDKIGYKVSMLIAFVGHAIWVVMGIWAYFISKSGDTTTAFAMLYWGSLILALANGTVEAFINPVVATMFNKDKTKWLNILHAGWPGGLVVAGISAILLDHYRSAITGDETAPLPWWIKIGIIAVPAVLYFLMLLPCKFPVQERVSSGVSYREMLAEFGFLGAIIVGSLITLQLMDFYSDDGNRILTQTEKMVFIGIGAAVVLAFTIYTGSLGRPLMFFLVLIMMPLATTEIGTDSWIEDIMKPFAKQEGFHSGWILVYTSGIMMVLRFFAGPIVHGLTPLGLLCISSALAIAGLVSLSYSTAMGMIFLAATLYGFGKTFFWPTMLGVVAEQTPKGGALTLNAISGIGMLAVGTLGAPYIGTLQSAKAIPAVANSEIAKSIPGVVEDGKLTTVTDKSIYEILSYKIIDDKALKAKIHADLRAKGESELADKAKKTLKEPTEEKVKEYVTKELDAQTEAKFKQLGEVRDRSKQGALFDMAIFPTFMLVCYVILILYFQSRGGYKPVHLGAGGH